VTSIVLAADEHYLPYVPANIAQIARYGRRADSVILAFPAKLDRTQLSDVESAAAIHDLGLTLLPVAEISHLYTDGTISDHQHISHFTYSKLLLADMLPQLDDVLYLDVDTLVRAPLNELLELELRHPLGAVVDLAGTGAHLFGTPREPYFNAGILRMSLARMRNERVWDQALSNLKTRPELTWQDQDVLNLIFRGRFDSLPMTYNVSDMAVRRYNGLELLADPVIVHFNGPLKPWHTSATSPFAREWRRQYAEACFATSVQTEQRFDAEQRTRGFSAVIQERSGSDRLAGLARTVLPAAAKRATKQAATRVVDRTLSRLEEVRAAIRWAPLPKQTSFGGERPSAPAAPSTKGGNQSKDHQLDLLISVARSGTNALGDVIQHSRPDIHWMNELYLGAPFAPNLLEGELVDQFPWFASDPPDPRKEMRASERQLAFSRFAVTMSENAVELTTAVLQSRSGRSMIKVFPEHLHPCAFEELLATFHPRLLIMRRDLIFTCISRLQAQHVNAWRKTDLTDVPYTVDERSALQYALQCDAWFDRVERLAEELDLHTAWITYGGLFTTGADIPVLQSFYPGPPLPVDPDSGALRSGLQIQHKRSDASILDMLKAVSDLSAATQSRLLRMPGSNQHIS
jgi:lipopolysaccharide biosynthesis glycosyltransferase